MTHYIRFPDEKTGMAALDAAGLLSDEGAPITATHDWAIDVIGPIYRGGTYDPETGEVITPPVALGGWHVNFAGEPPADWDTYAVTPAQPVRVWA